MRNWWFLSLIILIGCGKSSPGSGEFEFVDSELKFYHATASVKDKKVQCEFKSNESIVPGDATTKLNGFVRVFIDTNSKSLSVSFLDQALQPFPFKIIPSQSENQSFKQIPKSGLNNCTYTDSTRIKKEGAIRVRCARATFGGFAVDTYMPARTDAELNTAKSDGKVYKVALRVVGDALLSEGDAGQFTIIIDQLVKGRTIQVSGKGSEVGPDQSNGQSSFRVKLANCKDI